MSGWIGVDLDGTLAVYRGWKGQGHIGEPVPAMQRRVKEWLANDQEVRIFTARVAPMGRPDAEIEAERTAIQDWCEEHLGQRLEVTCCKDYGMIELWDDRCIQVIPNSGQPAV